MTEALLLVLLLTAGGLAISDTRRRMRIWEEAALSCGLVITRASRGWKPLIEARDARGGVWIGLCGEGARARIVVESASPDDFKKVTIRPQPPGFVPEIQVRDVAFDGEFQVLGPVRLVSALLDEETRRLLSLVNTLGTLEISAGALRVDLADVHFAQALSILLDLRNRFAAPLHIPALLARNARQDPVPGVRLHNLLLLIDDLPAAPETAEALQAGRSDPSPEVRLRVAIELGTQTRGRDLLHKLAADLEDDAVSARAFSFVSGDLSFGDKRDLLERALRQHRRQTARACLEAIGSSRDAAAVETLAKVLEQEHGDLAPVAARALGETGSPAAEPPLLQALERDHEDLQVAAAEALGHTGSAASVLPLKEAADRLPRVRQAARQAIVEIQTRLQGASPGQLSIAGTEAGQLSLADQAGQLSLPEGDED